MYLHLVQSKLLWIFRTFRKWFSLHSSLVCVELFFQFLDKMNWFDSQNLRNQQNPVCNMVLPWLRWLVHFNDLHEKYSLSAQKTSTMQCLRLKVYSNQSGEMYTWIPQMNSSLRSFRRLGDPRKLCKILTARRYAKGIVYLTHCLFYSST